MNKKKVTTKKSIPLWLFIHRYRTKIALLGFFLVLPLTLVLVAYLGPLNESRRVTFETTISEESEFISDFKEVEELKDLNLKIKWTDLILPELNEDDALVNGSYNFNVSYIVLNSKNITDVKVQIVLKSLYGDVQNISGLINVPPTQNGSNVSVAHNVLYPFSPLWFISVNEPTLYLKLTYRETFAGIPQPVEVVEYLTYSLENLVPTNVE